MFGSPGVDHFSASRSLRRIPAPMLRPSLFPNGGSPFHHSYNGPPSMISSPFSSSLPRSTNLAQMMAARHSLAMRGQPLPQPQQPKKTQLQQQPYCTVEEIKQGKRQREGQQRDEAAEENQYDVEEPDDEEEDEAADAADEEESSRDGDGDGLYERAPKASRQNRSGPADLMKQRQQQSRQSQTPPLPPPLPPPIPCFNNGKIAMKNGWKTSMPAKKAKEEEGKEMFKQRRNRTKLVLLLLLLVFLCSLLLVLPLTLLWWSGPAAGNDNNNHNNMPTSRLPPEIAKQPPSSAEDPISGSREVLVEAHTLAQWMTSNSKRLRIFEIRDGRQPPTNDDASGSSGSLLAHSVPLQLASLSHNGVPVHPLQLQRLLRAQSVDEDSIVVLYDRHPLGLLAAYALWIFRLYGHDSSFMLNGGLIGWQHFLANNRWNSTDAGGQEAVERRQGTFRAEWRQQLIATFDDLVNNFEPTNHGQADIVDAQSQQEFNGKAPPVSGSTESAAIFGHIRTALNLPVERLCLSGSPSNCGSWGPALDQSSLFAAAGLSPRRPVIVYDGASSLRAAAVWAALHRSNFSAALYFGAWPEWLIRAPDHLKIIPDK